jgi:hypothetical protein
MPYHHCQQLSGTALQSFTIATYVGKPRTIQPSFFSPPALLIPRRRRISIFLYICPIADFIFYISASLLLLTVPAVQNAIGLLYVHALQDDADAQPTEIG